MRGWELESRVQPQTKSEGYSWGGGGEGGVWGYARSQAPKKAVARSRHTQDSPGQILALALGENNLKPFNCAVFARQWRGDVSRSPVGIDRNVRWCDREGAEGVRFRV